MEEKKEVGVEKLWELITKWNSHRYEGEWEDMERLEQDIDDYFIDSLDRAREEGYKKGMEDQQHLDGLLYGTTVATTTTLEEGWILKHKKKVEEELSKLTTK